MSSDEPRNESFRERSEANTDDDTRTGIIRRHPTGPGDEPLARRAEDTAEPLSDDTFTSIIRREPTPLSAADESTTGIMRPAPQRIAGAPRLPSSSTAVAASTVSILSGWATSVVATALITGWWRTDRLFCVGVGFLTAVFGASTIAGVVGLLLRRRVGIYLSMVAAVLALLIFSGIFIAGARMAGVVYAFPVLPVTTVVLAVAPATWRWTKPMAASGQQ